MYIGKSPQTGAYSILDSLSASATASYTMQLNSVNYSPESAQHLIVSLNGAIQKPNSSFTCSGSTLTFSQALTSSDSIDFIYALGNVLDVGTVSDSTITNAKTNFVSTSSASGLQIKGDGTTDGTLQLNCSQNSHGIKLKSPPHSASASYTLTFPNDDGTSGQALTTNGSGVLTWADAGGTNTPNFHAYSGSNQVFTRNTSTLLKFETEVFDTANAYNNTASNYKFVVPIAGKYYVSTQAYFVNNDDVYIVQCWLYIHKNGSEVMRAGFDTNSASAMRKNIVKNNSLINLAQNDYLQVYAYCETLGGSDDAQISGENVKTFFEAYRIIE